jgi:hypothetical protein
VKSTVWCVQCEYEYYTLYSILYLQRQILPPLLNGLRGEGEGNVGRKRALLACALGRAINSRRTEAAEYLYSV